MPVALPVLILLQHIHTPFHYLKFYGTQYVTYPFTAMSTFPVQLSHFFGWKLLSQRSLVQTERDEGSYKMAYRELTQITCKNV